MAADILTFGRKNAAPQKQATTARPPLPNMNQRRIEGLQFVEALKASSDAVADRERLIRYETDKLTFMMRRALDFIPPRLLREIADEVATEHELRGR